MKRSLVKELKKRKIEVGEIKKVSYGRNNFSFKDKKENVFFKIYPDIDLYGKALFNFYFFYNKFHFQKILTNFTFNINKKEYGVIVFKYIKGNLLKYKANEKNIDQFANLLLKIHRRNVNKKFGDISPNSLKFNSWEDYLVNWINSNDYNRRISKRKYIQLIHLLNKYFNENKAVILKHERSLIHGDIDLSNFIVRGEHISVIDLDYSIIGDSAWEFASALANWRFSGKVYTKVFKVYLCKRFKTELEREEFKERVKFYGPIKKAKILMRLNKISQEDLQREINIIFKELRSSNTF